MALNWPPCSTKPQLCPGGVPGVPGDCARDRIHVSTSPTSCQKHRENRKTLAWEHIIACQCVVFTKIFHYYYHHYYYHQVLSQFEFLSFVTFFQKKREKKQWKNFGCKFCHYCHNFSFWFLSQFEFLSFCHKLIFWVFEFLSPSEFFSFITIWVFEFCHYLSFWDLDILVFSFQFFN